MASWRVARSLDTLLAQLNKAAPNRSKVSDGSIGDAAHASRDSDHNPWIKSGGMGVVTARDFTHDPKGGLDCNWLAARLVASGDPRIKYVIWNRRIWSAKSGWVAYKGTNPHDHHLHLSVSEQPGWFDSTLPWSAVSSSTTGSPVTTLPVLEDDMFEGSDRESLADIRRMLAVVLGAREPATQVGERTIPSQLVNAYVRNGNPEGPGRQTFEDAVVDIQANAFASARQTLALMGRPGADVDEAALAAALGPLMPQLVARLSDDDVARVAKASADEQSRRLAA